MKLTSERRYENAVRPFPVLLLVLISYKLIKNEMPCHVSKDADMVKKLTRVLSNVNR